jgi:hypothetical protein
MIVIMVMVMVMVFVASVIVLIATYLVLMLLVLPHLVTEVLFPLALMGRVPRRVHIVVPPLRHEVDRSATGVVLGTVSRPMLLVTRRYVQIQRRRRSRYEFPRGHGYDGPRHDQLGDVAPDRELPENARSIQIDGDAHIARERQRS